MAATFDVSAPGMLTEKAVALYQDQPEKFEAHNVMAETLLGVADESYTEPSLERIMVAVALQLCYQLELGLDAFVALNTNIGIQGGRGGQSTTYRGYKGPPLVHAQAKKMVDAVRSGDLETLTSIRGSTVPFTTPISGIRFL